MTEQTQTTAQRIQDMLDMNFNFYPGPPGVTAKTIAAEIDRLTAERNRYFADVIFNQNWIADMQRRTDLVIAQVSKELDEARADLAKCGADLQYEFDNPGDSRRRIAELEAEVERLRPAAEAWELLEHMYHNTGSSLAASYTKACIDKAARARAAKERKP